MACSPPYCHGTGGFCDCNCRCCPPDCCDTVRVKFKCGSSSADIGSGAGCDCDSAMFAPLNSGSNISFPKFSQGLPIYEDDQFVFALDGECISIPCNSVYVDLTTTGCCLEILGDEIYVIGAGTITANLVGSADPNCGTLTPKINGQYSPYTAEDCTTLTVTISVYEAGTSIVNPCCPCCDVEKTCYVPHTSMAMQLVQQNLLVRKTAIENGKKTIYLDKSVLIEKLKRRKKK